MNIFGPLTLRTSDPSDLACEVVVRISPEINFLCIFRPGQDARSEAEHSVLLPGTQAKRTERSGVSALGFSVRVIRGYVAAGIIILFF